MHIRDTLGSPGICHCSCQVAWPSARRRTPWLVGGCSNGVWGPACTKGQCGRAWAMAGRCAAAWALLEVGCGWPEWFAGWFAGLLLVGRCWLVKAWQAWWYCRSKKGVGRYQTPPAVEPMCRCFKWRSPATTINIHGSSGPMAVDVEATLYSNIYAFFSPFMFSFLVCNRYCGTWFGLHK